MRETLVLVIDWHMFWSRRDVSVVGVSRAFYFRVEKIDPIRQDTFYRSTTSVLHRNMPSEGSFALVRRPFEIASTL